MRLRLLLVAAALAAALVAAAPAGAFILQHVALQSATSGIALGPDGNLWVAEAANNSVARVTPAGAVIGRLPVGGTPTALASGPGGRVWVTVTNAQKLVWIDATAPEPATHDVSTGLPGSCGPVAITDGGDGRMFFSLPVTGACAGIDMLGSVAADTTIGPITPLPGVRVQAFDLISSAGKLFAPDFPVDRVVRVAQTANPLPEASINTSAGAGPQGVTADAAGTIWFTERNSGKVGRFAAAAANLSAADELTPTGGTLTNPFGIVAAADGGVYVAGSGSENIARVAPDGTFRFFPVPNSQPFDIVNGPGGDLWFTDTANARVVRFVNGAPTVTTNSAAATSPTTAGLLATVNPRGNDTSVVFDFGTTTAYGFSTAAVGLPAGGDPIPVTGALTGLTPGTLYHVRARATNAEGTTLGADLTFTTPAVSGAPAAPPGTGTGPGTGPGGTATVSKLAVTTSFTFSRTRTTLTLRRIALAKLAGGETATIRCTGKRCAFKARTFKSLKKGTRTLGKTLLKGRKLLVGTTVSVRVTKAGSRGTFTVLKVRRGRAPQITRRCLAPGATTPTACT